MRALSSGFRILARSHLRSVCLRQTGVNGATEIESDPIDADEIDERDDCVPAGCDPVWQAFVEEHPELARPSSLSFDDDELIPALCAAIEGWRQRGLGWPEHDRLRKHACCFAHCVAQQLTERPTRSDVLKVDAGLRRREKRGLVSVERPRHSANRYRLPVREATRHPNDRRRKEDRVARLVAGSNPSLPAQSSRNPGAGSGFAVSGVWSTGRGLTAGDRLRPL